VFERYAKIEAKEDRDIPDRIKYRDIVDALFPEVPKSERTQLAADVNRAFWKTASQSYPLRNTARRALSVLRSTGLRMGVVSNHHDYEALVAHLEESGIHSHFDVILASEREGVRKPNKAIFAKSLKALKVEKENAIFVGDSRMHDIVGARLAGITSVLIDDGEQLDSWPDPTARPVGPEATPDYAIRDLQELRGIVDSIGSPNGSYRKAKARRRHNGKTQEATRGVSGRR